MRTPEPDSKALSVSHHFHTSLGQDVSHNDDAEDHSTSSKGQEPILLHKSKSSPASLPTSHFQDPKGSKELTNGWTGLRVSKSFPIYLSKEMVRGFTLGLSKDQFEKILCKAHMIEFRSQDAKNEFAGAPEHSKLQLHPKAVLLGILEDFESRQRIKIDRHQSYIEHVEKDIEEQRKISNRDGKGLAQCSIDLSRCNLSLGRLRPRLQYLTSAIKSLHSCTGMPQSVQDLAFLFPNKAIREKSVTEREHYFGKFWSQQLSEIDSRLFHLEGKTEQRKVDVETLQHRVTGHLLMV